MNKYISFLFLFIIQLNNYDLIAGSAGKNYTYESQEIVLYPTAGLTQNCELFNFNFLGGDILVFSAEKTIQKDFSVGISFAIKNFVGNNKTIINKDFPAIKLKYRLLNEEKYYPAILLGFDSQNYLDFSDIRGNLHNHSIGPFVAISKAFSWQLGIIAIHFGGNLPIEYNPNKKVNFFVGAEHSLNRMASVSFEYSFDRESNDNLSIWNGITNIGIKYSIDKNVTLNLFFIDIFSSKIYIYRILNLQFITHL